MSSDARASLGAGRPVLSPDLISKGRMLAEAIEVLLSVPKTENSLQQLWIGLERVDQLSGEFRELLTKEDITS